MSVRLIVTTLIASTALSAVATAQNAPAQQQPPAATPAPVPPSAPTNFGVVTASEPAARPNPGLAQPGLTAAPTDINEARDRAQRANAPGAQPGASVGIGNSPSTGITPGGVSRLDFGGGYMIAEEAKKTRSTVTRDAIDKLSETANPYQMINLLPGVVASSPDNTGLNGGNIRIRGFNSDHIGLTVEGMPVNDSGSYALFPQEYVDGPNISHISIAQGTPDLDSPHVGSTGGVINIYMRDPQKEAGGFVSASVGSNNLKRDFIRLETGQVGAFRAFLSYSHLTKDNWAGAGTDDRTHIDFKTVWDLSKGNTIRFSAIYNTAVNGNYANPTKAQFNTAGYTPSYLSELPSSFFKTTSPIDQSAGSAFNYYKYRINPFSNLILSAPSNFTITDKIKFDTVPYFWYGFGNGGTVSTMNEAGMYSGNMKITNVNYGGTSALSDKILYYNPSVTETYRPGIINKLTYSEGNHKFIIGHWLEVARHRQTAPFVPLNSDGSVEDPFAKSNQFVLPSSATCFTGPNKNIAVTCPTGPLERRDQSTITTTNAVFLGDTWKATKNLTIDYGVKQVFVHRTTENYLPFAADSNMTLNDTATLPTVGASYQLDGNNKVFANFGTSFRSAPNFTMLSSYSITNGAYTPANVPAPERGRTFEIGHRYQGPFFATSVSAFNGYFENYQQSTNVIDAKSGGTGTVNETINAGRVVNYGVNAELGLRPIYNFRPYVSAELLRTSMLDNLQAGNTAGKNDFLPTAGKQLPGAPQFSMGVGLDYDDGHWFANATYKYIGQQYSTLMNDESISGFGRIDLGAGYRFSDFGFMKQPEIKLNLFNVANARQLVGVNGVQNNALATTGVGGGTINGSSPTYYMGQGASGMITFRAGF